MNIRYKDMYSFEFDNVLFINGSNKSGKTKLLKLLEKGAIGELENFYINNNKVYKNDFQVLFIGDYNNFATDFKLSKANTFKKLIYDDIIEKINTENILNKTNEIFNIIDDKINETISKNELTKNLKFDINIDSVDKIIEKFTNIYIDDYLLDDKITPRSSLRKLLINLTLYQIEKLGRDNIIVFIDDIDNSFDELELFNLIKTLETNNKAKFIVSSSRNIYPYVKNKKDIYKIYKQKTKNIVNIESCIKQSIITNEYKEQNIKDDFNTFFEENEYLINDEDINYFNKKILTSLNYQIGLIYCNDELEIKLIDDEENNIIKVKNNLEKIFLETIYNYLTNNIDKD
mgnify:FL=1